MVGYVVKRIAVVLLGLTGTAAFAQSSNSLEMQGYSEQGQKALAERRYADAEQAFEKLRELSPQTAEVYAQLGLVYFQEKKFDQAVPTLRQALKLKPGLPKLDSLLAMSLSEVGQYKEALPGLEKGFNSTDPAVKRMCGLQLERAYTGLHHDSKAVEVALELSRLYPNDGEVLYHNARVYGNVAFLTMEKLRDVAPNSVWRHQAAAEAYESQGSSTAAIGEYRQVLAMDPRRPGIHYRLGRTLLARSRQASFANANDKSDALKEFEQEIQLDPTNANALYEVAEIHRDAGEFDRAQESFEAALKYYPDFQEAHVGLAATLMAEHKPQDALQHLQKATALNPRDEAGWYRLAQAERILGNAAEQQKAIAEFQKLRSQQPTGQPDQADLFSPDEVTKQKVDPEAEK